MSWVIVCRHHYDAEDLDNDALNYQQINQMATVVSCVEETYTNSGYWGLGFVEGHGATDVGFQPCFTNSNDTDGYINNVYEDINAVPDDEDRVKNQYGIIGFWQQNILAGNQVQNAQMTPFFNGGWNSTSTQQNVNPNYDGMQPSGATDGKIRVGKTNDAVNGSVSGFHQKFEGRIAEMICIKSDNPIPMYLRSQILEYLKDKFAL